MPNGALLDPGNRLLGAATGDFSLYGALPAVTIGTVQPPAADPSLLTVPIATPAAEPGTHAASAPDAQPTDTGSAPMPEPLPAATIGNAPPPPPVAVSAPSQTEALQVASPIGSGSIAPIIADTSLPLVARGTDQATAPSGSDSIAPGLGVASLAAPVLAAAEAQTAATAAALALAPHLAFILPVLDATGTGVGNLVAAAVDRAEDTITLLDGLVQDTAAPITATVGSVAAALPNPEAVLVPVVETANTAADAIVSTFGATTATIGDTAAHTVDALTTTAATTIDTAITAAGTATGAAAATAASTTDAAATAIETVADSGTAATADAVDTVTGTTAAVAATVADTTGTATAAATDTLAGTAATVTDLQPAAIEDDLGGTDPAGGVTTLVSMVENAAMFEIAQPGEQPDDVTSGGSIIDALAADEAPASLLGDAAHLDHADGLLPSHDDHGVPGLS